MSDAPDLYRALDRVDVRKVKDVPPDSGVRLYCTQRGDGGAWCLQVRGMIRLANGQEGKDFVVASASVYREDMLALRDAIDAFLKEDT
jgi:hypothetical protein